MREFARLLGHLLDALRLQVGRQEVVIPGRGRVRGQEIFDAIIRAPTRESYRGNQRDAVEVDFVTVLQDAREFRRTRGSVAFADEVLRRIPPFGARDVLIDEIREPRGVFDDAVKLLRVFPGRGTAVAGGDGVDE